MGSAVTAHDIPTPTMNCQPWARGPIHPGYVASIAATRLPVSSGAPSARPAAVLLSRRCSQACFRSSSMPASMTKHITAHQAMPDSDCTTAGLNTKR